MGFVLDLSWGCYRLLKTWFMLSFLSLQKTSCSPPVCSKGQSSPDLLPLVASFQTFLRNQIHNFQTVHMLLSDLCVGRCKKNYSGMPEAELQQVSSRLMTSSWQAGQINQSPWRQWERPDPITHPTHLSPWAADTAQHWLRVDSTPHCCPQLLRHPENTTVPTWFPAPGTLHSSLGTSRPAIWVWPAELPPLQLDFLDSDSSRWVPSTLLSLKISQKSIFLLALKGWKTLC